MATNNAINLSQTGITAYDGAGNFFGRTLTPGSTKLSIADGNGVAGNPTLDVVPGNIPINGLLGTLAVAGGGTGAITLSANGILIGNGTSIITATNLTDGQLLIGSTAAAPVASTLTAGTNVSIVNAAGSITISSTGTVFPVVNVTGLTQAMTTNTRYYSNNAARVAFTLPATSSFGDEIEIVGSSLNAGGYEIDQTAGQQIIFISQQTTVGATGFIETIGASQANYCITLFCDVANLLWTVKSSAGNFLLS